MGTPLYIQHGLNELSANEGFNRAAYFVYLPKSHSGKSRAGRGVAQGRPSQSNVLPSIQPIQHRRSVAAPA